MSYVHHRSGALSDKALVPAVNRRLRIRDAEVALVATAASDHLPVQPQPMADQGVSTGPPSNGEPVIRIITKKTAEGQTRYLLQRLQGGLYVERQQSGGVGAQTIQTVIFRGASGFAAWCDEDPVRFEDPHLILRVRREGLELLQR